MDFTLDDEQQAIDDLADRILAERSAADAWTALAGADLLGLALPEAVGGSGLGILAAGLVARQVGRHVAEVPYWPSTAAAVGLARWGDDEQRKRWLAGALDGTAPLAIVGGGSVTPVTSGARWQLHGSAGPVPWARGAAALLVSTVAGLFVVDAAAPGLAVVDERAITGEPSQTVTFNGVAADLLPGGSEATAALTPITRTLLAMTMLGVCEEALALTARYVTERQQFGSPIGTFQAVAHRCADAYIDTEAIRLTTLQAAWQLDAGEEATDAVAVATFWACEAGHRVLHAAQHLHGGIGMDTDYPLYRYFRWATYLEALLGGPHEALSSLGATLSASAISVT